MNLHIINQIAIVVVGATIAFCLTRNNEKLGTIGSVLGLLIQPIWVYESYKSGQFGVMILSAFYTYSYAQGLYFFWIKKNYK